MLHRKRYWAASVKLVNPITQERIMTINKTEKIIKQKQDKKEIAAAKTKLPMSHEALRKLVKKITAEELKKLDKEKLQHLYDGAVTAYPETGGPPMSRKERHNLYIIQEQLFGGLENKLVTSLENIGETLAKAPDKRKKAIGYNLPSSGAVITKVWKGKKLEVKILELGFEYEGEKYKSLSKLAKEIAGYAVSGPIFFGLRKPIMGKPTMNSTKLKAA
jgi:hypothetical protein